jgi:adenylate cyclase
MGGAELDNLARSATARPTTVLFAEVGSPPGDPAATDTNASAPLARYLQVLGTAAELSGGRVLHQHTSGVLALFSTPDAAAVAAARMHAYAQSLRPEQPKLDVRIGFHAGPVAQRNDEIFGDTVNLALQIADEAKDGQILTSHDTASNLAPAVQELVKPTRGKKCELLLGKLEWQNAMNRIVSARNTSLQPRVVLRLTCQGATVVRRRDGDTALIGRDPECDLRVEGGAVSRRHCTILRRDAGFVLCDQSTNGTFVSVAGHDEVHVHAREVPLGKSGLIALGRPASATDLVVKYACEVLS